MDFEEADHLWSNWCRSSRDSVGGIDLEERLKAIAWAAFQAHPIYPKLANLRNTPIRGGPQPHKGYQVVTLFVVSPILQGVDVIATVWLDANEQPTVKVTPRWESGPPPGTLFSN
jgi:hypothetical protein